MKNDEEQSSGLYSLVSDEHLFDVLFDINEENFNMVSDQILIWWYLNFFINQLLINKLYLKLFKITVLKKSYELIWWSNLIERSVWF